jgi:hypothetical protein
LHNEPWIIFEECDMTGNRGTQRILATTALALLIGIGTANATLSGDFIDFVTDNGSLLNLEVLDAQVEFDRDRGDCTGPTPPAICGNAALVALDLAPSTIRVVVGEPVRATAFSFFNINDVIASFAVSFGGGVTDAVFMRPNNNILISDIEGGDGDILLTLTFEPQPPGVPEPSTLLLLGAGLVGLWARRRRN